MIKRIFFWTLLAVLTALAGRRKQNPQRIEEQPAPENEDLPVKGSLNEAFGERKPSDLLH